MFTRLAAAVTFDPLLKLPELCAWRYAHRRAPYSHWRAFMLAGLTADVGTIAEPCRKTDLQIGDELEYRKSTRHREISDRYLPP